MSELGATLKQIENDPSPNAIPRLLLRIRLANIVAEDAIHRLRAPESIEASVRQALSLEERGDVLTIQLAAAMTHEKTSQIRKFSKQVQSVDARAAKIESAIGLTSCALEESVSREG